MTFYGSIEQPQKVFGQATPELEAFYRVLNEELPGAMEAMADIQGCWQSDKLAHEWTLPDGAKAVVKVMVEKEARVEIDEMDHATFTYHYYANETAEFGISLCANVVHSVDAYVVREMVRRANAQGFELLTIHDNFLAHPNHMNKVRKNFLNIMMEIADSDLLQNILREITGSTTLEYVKLSKDLSKSMADAEYFIS